MHFYSKSTLIVHTHLFFYLHLNLHAVYVFRKGIKKKLNKFLLFLCSKHFSLDFSLKAYCFFILGNDIVFQLPPFFFILLYKWKFLKLLWLCTVMKCACIITFIWICMRCALIMRYEYSSFFICIYIFVLQLSKLCRLSWLKLTSHISLTWHVVSWYLNFECLWFY